MEADRANSTKRPNSSAIVFACVFLASLATSAIAQERLEKSSGTTGSTAEDVTIGALNKEKLEQEVEQLKKKNAWFWTNYLTPFATPISIVVPLLIAAGGYIRWIREQRGEREKQDDDRFQAVVSGLASADHGAKVGAAIMLRTFCEKGHERFYERAFELAVFHLRIARPADPDKPTERNALGDALIKAFRELYPVARTNWIRQRGEKYAPEALHQTFDASYVNLDHAYLWQAELPGIFMPQASIRETDLSDANLGSAQLWSGNFSKAKLRGAKLQEANLGVAQLIEADLSEAKLGRARLWAANLSKAKLCGTGLSGARLYGTAKGSGAVLQGANLRKANLEGADLREVNLEEADLCGANLTGANLERAKLANVKYNLLQITEVDAQGMEVAIEPTRWPSEFRPTEARDVSLGRN